MPPVEDTPVPSPPADRSRFPILVVDDEEQVRKLLRRALEREGYPVETAASVGEALDKLGSREFAVVLTDILMPGMSGMDFLELLRERDDEIAVIMLTALRDTELSIRAMKAGAYDFITKPYRIDDILSAIEKALEKRALILENREYQRDLERKVREQSRRIQTSFIRTIETLARTLEAREPETREHSLRVTEYAVTTAEAIGLSPAEVEQVRVAATLHDIGKLGVSRRVLNKAEALDREEVEHIHRHPLIAAEILGPIEELEEIIGLIRHHHEYHDGSGYPDGLAGEEIPLGARIIAVADAFDAITSTRPYRKAAGRRIAVRELREHSGSQFDPKVVEAFLKAMGLAGGTAAGPAQAPARAGAGDKS